MASTMSREASVTVCGISGVYGTPLWVRRELPAAGQPAGLGCQRHCPAHRCCKFLHQSCTDFTQSTSCSLSSSFPYSPHSLASLDSFSSSCSVTTFSSFLFSSFFLLFPLFIPFFVPPLVFTLHIGDHFVLNFDL
jgi:hypothetical protein